MLRIFPATLNQANEMIEKFHRHHKKVIGHRFSVGVVNENNKIVGIAVVGRPVARNVDQYTVAEVTRLVTDGTRNACSFLYGATARISKEMGFKMIQTYILDSELGISLKAAGWSFDCMTSGGTWNAGNRKGRREDQPMVPKQRWVKELNK